MAEITRLKNDVTIKEKQQQSQDTHKPEGKTLSIETRSAPPPSSDLLNLET
jgi:hypothetical protein